MKTVALVGTTGGIGKTTLAVNLAAASAAAGKRILVLGFRRDVGSLTGVKVPTWTSECPVAPIEAPVTGLDVLTAELEASAEWLMQPLQARVDDIRALVNGAGAYDVVLLDAPPNPTVLDCVAVASDCTVCVMSPTSGDRAATIQFVERLGRHSPDAGGHSPTDIWGVVNQVHTRDADAQRIASATTGVPVRWARRPIRYSTWYHSAGEQHRDRVFIPVLDSRRGSYPAVDICALAEELGLLH